MELQSILSHKTVTKGEVNAVLAKVTKVRQNIESNMPFVVEQFNEQMEATVGEAKSEIEAFYIRRTTELGLAALKASTEESMPVKFIPGTVVMDTDDDHKFGAKVQEERDNLLLNTNTTEE